MKNVIITLNKQIKDIKGNLSYYQNYRNVMPLEERTKIICELEEAIQEYKKAIDILNCI